MYNNRVVDVTKLSISEVKEYYEILRETIKTTHEEIVDYELCKERLIEYAYKNIDKDVAKEALENYVKTLEQTEQEEAEEKAGTTANAVYSCISHYERGRLKSCKYRKVRAEE